MDAFKSSNSRNDLRALYENKIVSAEPNFMEPELGMNFKLDKLGDLRFNASLTPDNLMQSHKMAFDIDQSYLPAAIAQCDAILEAYPIRDLK